METSSPPPPRSDKETEQALLELERIRLSKRQGARAHLPPAWTWGSRLAAVVLLALCLWSAELHGSPPLIYLRGIALPGAVVLFPEFLAALTSRRLRASPVRILLIASWGTLLLLTWPHLRALVMGFTR